MSEVETASWPNGNNHQSLQALAQRADAGTFNYSSASGVATGGIIGKNEKRCQPISEKTYLNGRGPLSTFSAKIDDGLRFEIVGDEVVNDFRAIRNIRNALLIRRSLFISIARKSLPAFKPYQDGRKKKTSSNCSQERTGRLYRRSQKSSRTSFNSCSRGASSAERNYRYR